MKCFSPKNLLPWSALLADIDTVWRWRISKTVVIVVKGQHHLPPLKVANDCSQWGLGDQILDVLKQFMWHPLQQFVAVHWYDTVCEYCGLPQIVHSTENRQATKHQLRISPSWIVSLRLLQNNGEMTNWRFYILTLDKKILAQRMSENSASKQFDSSCMEGSVIL